MKIGNSWNKKNCIAILERHTQRELISGIHEGIGQSKHSKVLSLYYRRDSSYEKIAKQFLWYSIYNDVLDHCRDFEVSQKQEDLKLKSKSQFYNVPAPTIVMKQIRMGLDNLPEVDDYRHLVGINCFGKRPRKNFKKYWKNTEKITTENKLRQLELIFPCRFLRSDEVLHRIHGVIKRWKSLFYMFRAIYRS